jgi:ribonuclease P protein component
MRFFHRKKNRLYTENEIGALFTNGYAHFIHPIKAIFITYEAEKEDYKVLISVSKRNFKKAVDRNRIKRMIKEAFRNNSYQITKSLEGKKVGINIALIYVSKNILDYKEIESLIKKQIVYLTNRLEKIE